MSYKIVAIIEARMTSSRLPGKHLMEANGKPMLSHLVERLLKVKTLNEIVIATTINSQDDVLEDLAASLKIGIFRGSENDVMGRVVGAGEKYNADIICEVTGDCPIIDSELVGHTINSFLLSGVDYVQYGCKGGLPDGMGSQVFYLKALQRSEKMTTIDYDREHVTPHIINNPNLFSSLYLEAPDELRYPDIAVTLDEYQDYLLIKKIIEYFSDLKKDFGCLDVINLLNEKKSWLEINKTVLRN
jgi:spore coat polysaccharide biosynthesis protein SpsF